MITGVVWCEMTEWYCGLWRKGNNYYTSNSRSIVLKYFFLYFIFVCNREKITLISLCFVSVSYRLYLQRVNVLLTRVFVLWVFNGQGRYDLQYTEFNGGILHCIIYMYTLCLLPNPIYVYILSFSLFIDLSIYMYIKKYCSNKNTLHEF